MKTSIVARTFWLAMVPLHLTFNSPLFAAPTEATNKQDQQASDQTTEKRKQIYSEANDAILETRGALKLLDEGKKKEALASLERATGKLDLILAREPKLALAPSGVGATTVDLVGGIDAVKLVRKQAETALKDGRIQEARHLLRYLASETVVSVTNIPLATFPNAMKQAAKLVDENKLDEAKLVLQTALNTMVVTDTIIPLPVVGAERHLKEAEKLAEKKDRTPDESKRLTEMLKEAHGKLEYAQALGYGAKNDFNKLYSQLSEIEKKTESGKSGTGFFAKVKSSLNELLKWNQNQATDKKEASQALKNKNG